MLVVTACLGHSDLLLVRGLQGMCRVCKVRGCHCDHWADTWRPLN